MSDIGIKKTNHLYWMGRYAERAVTLLDILCTWCGNMSDDDSPAVYREFCMNLGIPDRFSGNRDFITGYLADNESPFSLMGALEGAEHNLSMLRGEVPVRPLQNCVQAAMENLDTCVRSGSDINELPGVKDSLVSFWDSMNVVITDENCRGIVIAGRFTERVDLYTRFQYPNDIQRRTMNILLQYVGLLPETLRSTAVVRALEQQGNLSPD